MQEVYETFRPQPILEYRTEHQWARSLRLSLWRLYLLQLNLVASTRHLQQPHSICSSECANKPSIQRRRLMSRRCLRERQPLLHLRRL